MNRKVLITGIAGGIGRATAKVFSEDGWHVIGVDRQAKNTDLIVDYFIKADISNPAEIESIFFDIQAKEGQLDALINNAAIQVCKPILETSLEEWEAVMSNNLKSVFLAVKNAYPLLRKVKGAIVNVSSVHAIATSKNIAAYAASKGAMLALTRAMALEFGSDGVRVNAILPGAVDTAMLRDGLDRGIVQGQRVEELMRGLGRKHVLGRVGQPEEIGKSIFFLADNNQSSFMTGQALVVDGGATARLSTE